MNSTAKCKILINSSAGALHHTSGPDELRALIFELGLNAEVVTTESPDEMDSILRQVVADGEERVAVSGGDGTVSRAVQILAKSQTALGILPQGTANNFANSLGLPMDLRSALKALDDGIVRDIDLGFASGRYFTEASGVGLFADVLSAYGTGTNKNIIKGIYAIWQVFFSMKARRVKIRIDGKMHTQRATACIIANSKRMGEGIPVAPEARLSDDQLDIIIIGDLTRWELIPYYLAFRDQKQMTLPKVWTGTGREIVIEGPAKMKFHIDDQVVGATPVTVRSAPAALKVLAPKR
ncbi:MAG: diacylglycerol kinase family protein [Chthonomonadales bacterium]